MKPTATLCTVIAACLLTACASFNGLLQAPPPANAAQPCPALPAVGETLDMGQLIGYTVDVANAYHDCAARHKALIDYITP